MKERLSAVDHGRVGNRTEKYLEVGIVTCSAGGKPDRHISGQHADSILFLSSQGPLVSKTLAVPDVDPERT
jgi:hypothetical protein